MALDLSLTPIKSSTLTADALTGLLTEAQDLLSTLPSRSPESPTISWTSQGKGDADITVLKATYNNEPWLARVLHVSDVSYEAFYRGLVTEKNAIELASMMGDNNVVETVGEERIFEGDIHVHDVHKILHVQAFSAREFLETVVTRDLVKDKGKRSCVIVSLPREGELRDQNHAHGVYVSVESVREVGDGSVEVVMACASDARGSIPRWMQNMAMGSQVLSDGQKFVKYLRAQK